MSPAASAIAAGVLVALAVAWAGAHVARGLRRQRDDAAAARRLQLLTAFAPAAASGDGDPKTLLAWHPVAEAARRLFPGEFAALDRAAGSRFPIDRERVQAAHARWTSAWLTWEQAHDATYKQKAAAAEDEILASAGSAAARARLDALERQKLQAYQQRYEEYVRVAKGLQSLL